MKENFRILHIGDLHFWRIPLNPFVLLGKRALGVGNLLVGGRSRKFRQELAPTLVEKLRTLEADALLFSGDFSSTALRSEFRAAEAALLPLVDPFEGPIHAVPGNHDCYTRRELTAPAFYEVLGKRYGVVREQVCTMLNETIGLLALNATTDNRLGSHGRITDHHMEFFRKELPALAEKAKHLIVLCHFPAEDPPGVLHRDRGIQLHHGDRLLELIRDAGIPTLWLHGHHHYRWVYGSPSTPNLTYLNAGAPFLRRGQEPPDMGFHELLHGSEGFRIITHRFDRTTDQWVSRDVHLPASGEYEDLQKG